VRDDNLAETRTVRPATEHGQGSVSDRIFLASSNAGKLREYRDLAAGSRLRFESLPNFSAVTRFDESAPTFAENASGKALHYSRYADGVVLADDSGLVVPALGGVPGVHSARYAGPEATDVDRYHKLLCEMEGKEGNARRARFVCVIAMAKHGRALVIVSEQADGVLAKEPRGSGGFGYDPIFLFPELGSTYAELTPEQKNTYSHRGKAFRKLLNFMEAVADLPSTE
jgi:XTP/dITP diphosphohydrolase